MLGLYPNVQTLSVQGLLLAGAALALVLLLVDAGTTDREPAEPMSPRSARRQGRGQGLISNLQSGF